MFEFLSRFPLYWRILFQRIIRVTKIIDIKYTIGSFLYYSGKCCASEKYVHITATSDLNVTKVVICWLKCIDTSPPPHNLRGFDFGEE